MTPMNLPKPIKTFAFLLCLVVVFNLTACGLQIKQKGQVQPIKPAHVPNTIEKLRQVPVFFTVDAPSVAFDGFELALDILDDLSGYQDNIRRYPMQNVSENRYEVSVLLDEGFDIRYRYTMIQPEEAHETDALGNYVAFRLAIAEKDLTINDKIQNWMREPSDQASGTLTGVLRDAKSQAGIPDVLISIAGMQTFTDMTGTFRIENLPEGTYNLVAYAVNGAYPSLQQKAVIATNSTTKVDLSLEPLNKVSVQFQVKPSAETIGVPIRLAGNLLGSGAYFGKDYTQSGSYASLMPLLDQVEAESYEINLDLYAGSAFRYRYTLGNGYINAERSGEGLLVTRSFIVPKSSTTVKDEITGWRANAQTPITINVDAPVNMPQNELVSVQVKRNQWDQAIPMWHVADNKWMFLLYGNGQDVGSELRFCRNNECALASDETTLNQPLQVNFFETVDIDYQITKWHNWEDGGVSTLPKVESGFQVNTTGIELIKEYNAGDLPYMINHLKAIRENGVNWLILQPVWDVLLSNDSPILVPSSEHFILYQELGELAEAAKAKGMKVSVYPKLNFPAHAEEWWNLASRSEQWWQRWYQEYAHFLNNFAVFSETFKLDHFIISENDLKFTYPNGLQDQGAQLGTPEHATETWQSMLDQVKGAYFGEVLWASLVHDLPDFGFLDRVNGYYVLFNYSDESHDAQSLSQTLNQVLLPFYQRNQKKIYIGINIPALSAEAMEYTDHMEPISSTSKNGDGSFVDLNLQADLYKVFTCNLKSLDWISGVSTRGFNLGIALTDMSSSIFGKPAMIEFLNCMNNTQ